MPAPSLPQALPALGIARLSIAGCTPFLALIDGAAQRMVPAVRWRHADGHALLGADTIETLLQHWHYNAALLQGVRAQADWAPLEGLQWHAPVRPAQVFCTIGNYQAQVIEAALDAEPPTTLRALEARREVVQASLLERQRHGAPYAVSKPAATVCGPLSTIALYPDQQTLDWEVEIGAVIGCTAWQVSPAEAMQHIAGYCTVNDVTLRQRLFRTDVPAMGTDFLQAKGGPGWLPVGPCLVPAHEVPDPHALRLQLRLNGQVMQDGTADDMVFDIAAQIAYLSHHVRLEPGDLVCTGSPAGFGQHHRRFLRPGDSLEAEVLGLGAQRTGLLAASTS